MDKPAVDARVFFKLAAGLVDDIVGVKRVVRHFGRADADKRAKAGMEFGEIKSDCAAIFMAECP